MGVRFQRPFSLGIDLFSDPGATTRVDISSGIQASLAGRYAIALFELARDEKQIDIVAASLASLRQALAESDDLRELTSSPLLGREEQARAVGAVAGSLGVDPLTTNFLGVLANNRRLPQLPNVIRAYNLLAARHRGELTAEVTSAHPLNDGQVDSIKQHLRTRMGRDIAVDLTVDPAILGGLVVKIGSQMIDNSIRTKLNNLAHAMKG
jgi:F-type H+-transporting ATPase subunit delta